MRVRSRSLLWIGLFLFSAIALGSCSKPQTGPAMWHITDADSDIYLFGTFHLLPANLDWQKPAMVAAFDKSSILIMEADVTGAAPGDVVKLIQQYGLAPPDKPLRSRLTPDEVKQYEAIAKSVGLDPAVLDPYQPWYAATVLSLKYAQAHGMQASEGAEEKLVKAAETENKPRAYLETIEQQIQFLAGLPEQTQNEMFVATLKEVGTSDKLLSDMQTAWEKGDTKAMAKLFDSSIKEVPDLYQTLIVERNKRWAGEIQKLLAGSGKVFIAVGTGHLVGNDSVVALLRERGIKVEGP
ncbi:MAG: TraB/GumN family protein [Alphaproteobacteria bacterium]